MARETEHASLVVDGEMMARGVEEVMARDAAHETLGKPDPERRGDFGRQVCIEFIHGGIRSVDDMGVPVGAVHGADSNRMKKRTVVTCQTFRGQRVIVDHE